jgi:hypothetical protein
VSQPHVAQKRSQQVMTTSGLPSRRHDNNDRGYRRRMFEHRIISVRGKTLGGVVEKAQEELDRMSADGWELVAATEQAPTSLSVRLFFKKPAA